MSKSINSWVELSERLEIYGKSISTLGGMNDLDKALYMAVQGINLLIEKVPGCGFSSKTASSVDGNIVKGPWEEDTPQ